MILLLVYYKAEKLCKSVLRRFQGPGSQNFLCQICKLFMTKGLNILGFINIRSVFEANIIRDRYYLQ